MRSLFWFSVGVLLVLVAALAFAIPDAPRYTEKQQYYFFIADKVNEKYGLPEGLVKAICRQETNSFDPNWMYKTGAHGEIGACQLKPSTVRKMCAQCVRAEAPFYLVVGSQGRRVEQVQSMFVPMGRGFANIGMFDEQLKSLVLQFQQQNKLLVDGIVGPQTWKALFGEDMPGSVSLEKRMESPEYSIELAGMYLAWLKNELKTNDPMILAAAYNGGNMNGSVRYMAAVSRLLSKGLKETP